MPISLLHDKITSRLARNEIAVTLFLDLKKAFDTVDHKILLKTLWKYGVLNDELKLYESYLHRRCQRTVILGEKSHSGHVSIGIPQGSILGPLLFNVYINDIFKSSNIPQFYLFADDTAFFFEAQSIEEVTRQIDEVTPNYWLAANRLTLNISKTFYQVYSITNNRPNININFNFIPIERARIVKYLMVCHLRH